MKHDVQGDHGLNDSQGQEKLWKWDVHYNWDI